MPTSTPWKVVVTGGVGVIAGVALLTVEWTTLAPLAAFVGMALVARGALRLVAAGPFVGFEAAFVILAIAGDVGVGITVLAWPDPTRQIVVLLVGSWAIVRAIAGGTIAATTRADHPWWLPSIALAMAAGVLGAIVLTRSSGSVHSISVIIGLLVLLQGSHEVLEGALRHRQRRVREPRGESRPATSTVRST